MAHLWRVACTIFAAMTLESVSHIARVVRAIHTLQLKLASTLVAATVILVVGAFGRSALNSVREESDELRLARKAVGALDGLLLSVIEVEAGQRGYILT